MIARLTRGLTTLYILDPPQTPPPIETGIGVQSANICRHSILLERSGLSSARHSPFMLFEWLDCWTKDHIADKEQSSVDEQIYQLSIKHNHT